MRRFALILLTAALPLTAWGQLSTREIAQRVSEALVLLQTQDPGGEPLRQASAFLVAPGIYATNLHAFRKAVRATVQPVGMEKVFPVRTVVGFDVGHDLCLFIVEGSSGGRPLSLRTRDGPSVGDELMAGGNPLGLEGTFTKGIVSALRRDMDLLQIDAAISPGSSGGPVVDMAGRVIGVASTSLVKGQNLNFAVPARFVAALPRNGKLTVAQAGALLIPDQEKEGLSGPVMAVVVRQICTVFNRDGTAYRIPGRVTERRSYSAEGWLLEEEAFTCGPFSAGQPVRRMTYIRDADGFILRTEHADGNGAPRTREWSREEAVELRARMGPSPVEGAAPKMVTVTMDVRGRPGRRSFNQGRAYHLYTYDARGDLEQMQIFEGKDLFAITRFAYTRDARGNWTRKVPSHWLASLPDLGFVEDEAVTREIAYH
jgi:hypothetical protein